MVVVVEHPPVGALALVVVVVALVVAVVALAVIGFLAK